MAYEKKYREQVLEYLAKGNTYASAKDLFGVGETAIKRWKKLKQETGSVEDVKRKPRTPDICPDLLASYVNKNPDKYLREIAEEFNCTPQAIFYALKRMKITRKKNGTVCGKK